jgi:DNA modification methylase
MANRSRKPRTPVAVAAKEEAGREPAPPNLLFYGDNLKVLRDHGEAESVDLVYLDPPFKSDKDYNVLFEEKPGVPAASQLEAFTDTWKWDERAAEAYREVTLAGGKVSVTMRAFMGLLGQSDMLAYLSMMAPRLIALQGVMKPSASIVLHCDPTASHYLKLLMDAVFGARNFRNEIAWCYTGPSNTKRWFPRKHDILLFYVNSDKEARFFREAVRVPYKADSFTMGGTGSFAAKNREGDYTTGAEEALARGKVVEDYWTDIPALSVTKERLGFETQKPRKLLERIIKATTEPGDLVLDPFCGCGTTVEAAEALGRRWVGIDVTQAAIAVIKNRLATAFKSTEPYEVIGEPESLADARVLAADDPYQFQWWVVGNLLGARVVERKKGRDEGVDGRLLFIEDPKSVDVKQIIVSVKAGGVAPNDVRALNTVVNREEAAMGVLVTLEDPSAGLRKAAATGEVYESPWGKHPKIQVVSVAELMSGKRLDAPPLRQTNVSYARATQPERPEPERFKLFGPDEPAEDGDTDQAPAE